MPLFEQAVARDPKYAEAHAALGEALSTSVFHQVRPDAAKLERARAELQRALDLDPGLSGAQATLSWLQFFHDHDWRRAEPGFRRALAINPNDARAHDGYALALAARRRFHEAVEHVQQAVRLDPVRYLATNDLGTVLYLA